MLVKLHRSGHRVLLFSTMTKMLDTVEFYLSWRQVDALDGSGRKVLMQRRRIDGSTTLEERERAIQEFNRPHTGERVCG
jgi:SWI/SNF-related matrix-associated actin-dependent regulator of chromatin subfamily A protein 2/4